MIAYVRNELIASAAFELATRYSEQSETFRHRDCEALARREVDHGNEVVEHESLTSLRR